ncbi:hypothetical protein GHT06_004047 [Daphnia sinensis]|nr:hypothetical protein GHT06_004047 [Daphnia sinensis]
MERIIDIFDEVNPGRFIGVDLVMSDYESTIQGSLTAALHGSQAVGCFFHYSQDFKPYYTDRIRRETKAIQEGIKKLNTYFLAYWIGKVSPEHDARSRMDLNDSSNNGTPDQERPVVRPRRRFLAGLVRTVLPPPAAAEVRPPTAEVQQPNADVQQPTDKVQTRPVLRRNSPRVTRKLHHLSDDIPNFELKVSFCVCLIWLL